MITVLVSPVLVGIGREDGRSPCGLMGSCAYLRCVSVHSEVDIRYLLYYPGR